MSTAKFRFTVSTCLLSLAATILISQPKTFASSSDSFPWSNMPVESSGDGAYVMEDTYGSMRDSNMQPDQIPENAMSTGLRPGVRASGSGAPIALTQAGQMPYTPEQNAINAPGLTPQASSYQRTEQGFIPTANDNVVQSLDSLQGNVPLRGGSVPPGSTISAAGVAIGNVDSTQSGPGAAGLFTPAGPGNAAALAAQMQGGLTASPIVDGEGTNLDIAVPVATPSEVTDYEHFTIDGTTGLMRDTVYSTGPVAGESVPVQAPSERLSTESTSDFIPIAPVEDNGTLALRGSMRPVHAAARLTNTTQLSSDVRPGKLQTVGSSKRAKPSDPTSQIGAVTGAIDWGNGDVSLFGTQGEFEEEKGNVGTLVLNSGASKTVRGQDKKVHSIEQRM